MSGLFLPLVRAILHLTREDVLFLCLVFAENSFSLDTGPSTFSPAAKELFPQKREKSAPLKFCLDIHALLVVLSSSSLVVRLVFLLFVVVAAVHFVLFSVGGRVVELEFVMVMAVFYLVDGLHRP